MAQNIDQLNIEIQAGAEQATAAIRTLKKSVAELKDEMSDLSGESKDVVNQLEDLADVAATTSKKTTGSTSGSWWNTPLTAASGFKGYATVSMIKQLAQGLAGAVTRASDLTEVMNLFGVALGENAQEGLRFIEMLENGLGINALDSANYMAQFYQISHALGLADESALKLSKDFTKLTYDLASLFNIDFNSAFEKLRAGLVGETEPLR